MKMNSGASTPGYTSPLSSSKPPFYPGYLAITGDCLEALDKHHLSPFEALARHMRGDWGDASTEAKARNDRALSSTAEDDWRIFSVYRLSEDVTIWIISEDEWGSIATTIMLFGEASGLGA